MIKLKKSESLVLVGLLALSFVPCIGGAFRLIELSAGLNFLPENPRIQSAPLPAAFHIIGSSIYCILGAFQFLPSIGSAYTKWHRLAGRLLVSAGTVSAISGLWMTHYYPFPDHLQGSLLYFVRLFFGLSMAAYIFLGLSAVLRKRMTEHQAWMIRAYALGLGAGTQVLIAIPWLVTVGEPSGFTRDVLMTTAWIINIVVGEWIINQQKKKHLFASYPAQLKI